MKTMRVRNLDGYLSPTAQGWAEIAGTRVTLTPTPLPMQPTEYVRRSWAGRPYGQTAALEAASVHDGRTWAIRASWEGSGSGPAEFPDALAVALPVRNDPPLILMGRPDAPIHILRWQASRQGVTSLLATGIGLSVPGPAMRCTARSARDRQIWHVVVTRTLGAGGDVAPLQAGRTTGIGFALWRGANDERAGIKAFSMDWTELVLEA